MSICHPLIMYFCKNALKERRCAKRGEEKIDENSVRRNSLGAVCICSQKSIMEPKKLIAVTLAAGG